ncbi:PTS sugar transporter subunit IIA [Mobilicoccus massiliensis]|uniref:PTS sugar transporter subunit IIA n=1 Tax=Mobilicoccus massiliensis TaxID=1522310 RepID=UPI00058ED963|nr:PTS sugar transporter subunit IIA [Mobilicoccus massiliensis]
MSSLVELVDPRAARVDVDASDWRAGIRAAGDLLVATGVSGESYSEAMIANVEQHGPYIVIAPGFAFAHSRPDASVTRTGMSIVRLRTPVEFGSPTNDPVTLVLALAAVDADAHQDALATLAKLLSDPDRRRRLDEATSAEALRAALGEAEDGRSESADRHEAAASSMGATADQTPNPKAGTSGAVGGAMGAASNDATADTVPSKGFILTVCGNGLGTSLFLKNTLEQVLDTWGWTPFVRVEATDTISARGRANEADVLLTSDAIAQAIGDVGTPVEVVDDFTSTRQVDAALRRVYAV